MTTLNTFDYSIILVYLVALLLLGLFLSKKAGASLDDYFLGGRKIPWWAMGMSGMAAWMDMTGTMIIVSFLYMLGPRGLYIEFRGGAVLILAFLLLWTGKWHRRSGCMTGAEWNIFRFGSGAGGQFARIVAAVAAIVWSLGMIAYMVKGVGLFLSIFLPFSPTACALGMVGVATIYTMASGFYGVIYTDILQSGIILVAVVVVSLLAVFEISNFDGDLASLANEVTGSQQWTTTALSWHTTMPAGYEAYENLGLFALFYLLRNVMGGMGSGADPKYFGARSDRECGLLSFMTGWMIMFRWPMMIGIAVLGLFLVQETIPDQSVLSKSAEIIRESQGDIPKHRWEDSLAHIMHNPAEYPALVDQLEQQLGAENWQMKLKLLSHEGTVNPERILPIVLLMKIPAGLRGLILVALIAASMSTFDSTLNMTTGYFTRDVYQAYLRPEANNRELMLASYVFGIALVGCGFLMGSATNSINHIWDWLMMGLGAGLAVPTILRLYWWRYNAGGLVAGTIVGLVAAVVQRMLYPDLNTIVSFSILTVISFLASIVGTFLAQPTDPKVLEHFYLTTRPFGLWAPLKKRLPSDVKMGMEREHRNDLCALPFALCWQISLFMLPMQLIIGAYQSFCVTLIFFLIGLSGLYFFWYRNLPSSE